ncbi:uncharacterized protein LOC119554930 [Drosophila subpulchrella]|uniref:uncharacterized protein LOC119554930 n=1 Tax=Drosophila subpulchrella TaxID=1486046 RepID=UPI0018A13B9F|nr:uncharacterized protein LOC119554930 [Drosophila subpulchrella]
MLLVLAVFSFISFTYGAYRSKEEVQVSFPQCESIIKDPNSNPAINFQCLVVNYNLSATLEDVILKMDQVQQHLDRIFIDDQKYKPSPFKNIDDILEIPIDISSTDCQTKRHILQAIRRKLEWYKVMNERSPTLFAWPSESSIYKPQISEQYSNVELRSDYSKVMNETRCLLAKAIGNTESFAKFGDEF